MRIIRSMPPATEPPTIAAMLEPRKVICNLLMDYKLIMIHFLNFIGGDTMIHYDGAGSSNVLLLQ